MKFRLQDFPIETVYKTKIQDQIQEDKLERSRKYRSN